MTTRSGQSPRYLSDLPRHFPMLPVEVVGDTVHHCHEQFDGRPIRDFVPVLVERMARTGLDSRNVPG